MTGGQPHDGNVHPWTISQQVHAEGVRRIALVSDEPDKYPIGTEWAPGVTFHHRDAARRGPARAARVEGRVGADLRPDLRRREAPPPQARHLPRSGQARVHQPGGLRGLRRLLGRSPTASSVTPVETEFGSKRAIDQSSCNKDFSCLNGFCPSFVTVEGGGVRKGKADKKTGVATAEPPLPPAPVLPSVADKPYGVLITGIGGTGVVTIGAIMGMAAHIEGKGVTVLDQLGMAQKGGAVISHVRIGATPEALHAVRLGAGGADLLLGCDLVVSASADALARLEPGASHAIVNTHQTITGEFTRHPDLAFPANTLKLSIEAAAGAEACDFVEATEHRHGAAGRFDRHQHVHAGLCLPEGPDPDRPRVARARDRAERRGRGDEPRRPSAGAAAPPHDRAARRDALRAGGDNVVPFGTSAHRSTRSWPSRVKHLTGYQNAALAERYQALVETVRAAEQKTGKTRPRRSGRAQLRQAAGLQGRVRGRAALRRRRPSRPSSTGSSRATTS